MKNKPHNDNHRIPKPLPPDLNSKSIIQILCDRASFMNNGDNADRQIDRAFLELAQDIIIKEFCRVDDEKFEKMIENTKRKSL